MLAEASSLFMKAVKTLLRLVTGKKHNKIKLHRLRKLQIWTFGSLAHQINSL